MATEELIAFLRAPLRDLALARPASLIPRAPPTEVSRLPVPLNGLALHNIIILSNRLPRRVSEVMGHGAAAAGRDDGGAGDSEDMDISDGAAGEL